MSYNDVNINNNIIKPIFDLTTNILSLA